MKEGEAVLKSRQQDLKENLALYLGNKDTERILFRPIKVGGTLLALARLMIMLITGSV